MGINKNLKFRDDRIHVFDCESHKSAMVEELLQSEDEEEAFYICDVNEIISRYNTMKMVMPRVEPFYAVKCNGSQVVLETMVALGANFDCASKEEIKKMISMGVHPSQIIYAHPTKIIPHIKYAAAMGVDTTTFDSEGELYKIKKYQPNARLLIRIKYDDKSAFYVLGGKFGCDAKTQAFDLLRIARSLDLNVIGVAFHIGSHSQDFLVYKEAIAAARSVFDMARNLGYEFNVLDIGGGFPGGKKDEEDNFNNNIRKVGGIINVALEEHFPDPSIRIISEPGRVFVNTAFTLISNIHSVRSLPNTDLDNAQNTKTQMYYLDISIFGTLFHTIFKEYYTPKILKSNKTNVYYPSVIWGTSCHTHDKITENIILPELKIGDRIIFEDVGAYTLAYGCEFNGIVPPKVISVIDSDGWSLLSQKASLAIPKHRFLLWN